MSKAHKELEFIVDDLQDIYSKTMELDILINDADLKDALDSIQKAKHLVIKCSQREAAENEHHKAESLLG